MLYSLLPPSLLDKSKKELKILLTNKSVRKIIADSIENGVDNWENYGKTVGLDNIMPVGLESNMFKKYEGRHLSEIALALKKNVYDVICDILLNENFNTAMIMFSMNEENVVEFFKHPKHLIGSDGLYGIKPHPRTYGAFPAVFRRFCRELKAIDVMDALYQMTKFPARRFNIKNTGEIKKGYIADITIFDYNSIKDNSDYSNPCQYPTGIKQIIIGGKIKFNNWD